ncbi:MAG: hypothetical protein OCD01_05800 [Fibrobacterales bacterium]
MRPYSAVFLLWVIMTVGCSLSDSDYDQSGDSTDFPNAIAGVVVDSLGLPQQNASVYLLKSAGWLPAQNSGESVVLDSTVTDSVGAYSLSTDTKEVVALEVSLDSFGVMISGIDPAIANIQQNTVTVEPKRWYQLTITDTVYFGKTLEIYETRHSLIVSDSGTIEFYGMLPENSQFFVPSPQSAAFHRLSDSVVQIAVSTTPFTKVLDTTAVDDDGNDTEEVTDPVDASDTTATVTSDTVVVAFDSFDDGDWRGAIDGMHDFTWYIQLLQNTWYHPLEDRAAINQEDVTIGDGYDGYGISVVNFREDDSDDEDDISLRGVRTRFDDTVVNVSAYTHLRFYIKGNVDVTVDFQFDRGDGSGMYTPFMGVFPLIEPTNNWSEVVLSLEEMNFKTALGPTDPPDVRIIDLLSRLRNVGFITTEEGRFDIDSIEWLIIEKE